MIALWSSVPANSEGYSVMTPISSVAAAGASAEPELAGYSGAAVPPDPPVATLVGSVVASSTRLASEVTMDDLWMARTAAIAIDFNIYNNSWISGLKAIKPVIMLSLIHI